MSKSIVKACVRYNDRLYIGFDHGECFKKLNEDNTILIHSDIEQGFVDSDGNFVDRKQAMIIAKENGQLTYETDKKTLISEDLHLDWLNKQSQRIAELEEQLKNSRVKFFIGFDSDFNLAVKELDLNIVLPNWMHDKEFKFYDTKEEALAKLRELQGESK